MRTVSLASRPPTDKLPGGEIIDGEGRRWRVIACRDETPPKLTARLLSRLKIAQKFSC
jgi:hypothetical protein